MSSPALISPRYRLPALALAALGWVGCVVLGLRYAGARHAGRLDTAVIHQVYQVVGEKGPLAALLVSPSSPPVVYAVIGVTVLLALLARRWEFAALAILGPALAVGLVEWVGKPLVDRRLAGALSYPSGHTVSTISAFTVAMLGLAAGARIARKVLALLAWLVVTASVMVGLVGMNYHYPTDTLGGLGVVLGTMLPAAVLVDLLAARRVKRQVADRAAGLTTKQTDRGRR
ncbi:MAG TPA: phosphatase PAP2 family protein [Pseudonocardia sp.]